MSAEIDGFAMDVFVSEDAQLTSDVTRYPVEAGADHSDHIIDRPITLSVEGIVSDTPLTTMTKVRDQDSLPSNDAYAHLLKIREEKRLVTVKTSKREYSNMALLSLSDPRTSSTGDGLLFRASFQQLTTTEVAIEDKITLVELPRHQKKRKPKPKPPEEVKEVPPAAEAQSQSLLHSWVY